MESKLLIILLVGVFAYQVKGYGSGAPADPQICETLTPKHPGEPQTVPSPYDIKVDKTQAKSGDTVEVSISSDTAKFKGFLVQGRKSNYERETAPVGKFLASANSGESQTIKCGSDDSTITHTGKEEKSEIKLKWVAPQEKGVYILLTTVVQDGHTYWVRQPSSNITIT